MDMKATELRIGNMVKLTVDNTISYKTIKGILESATPEKYVLYFNDTIRGEFINDIQPIEIDEVILEEWCGIKLNDDVGILFDNYGEVYEIQLEYKDDYVNIYKRDSNRYNDKSYIHVYSCGYLHELQNYYYILTGKELVCLK